ncbi:hypothetical protein HYDPIDRAFT_114191 [Hydnomerulius pinastri MD-312]|uniref:Queuosine 5'-phosphate N-glycosylase/hydrolase n=1 Tax=Hydnomerulius pinastri MD-312 TaxID=994086 RepID=A0A0C9VA35_9AGAM|nr:hypothetical protein HYDPIDRAFT_114191 [Hydnomerulius pinastri MD-312]
MLSIANPVRFVSWLSGKTLAMYDKKTLIDEPEKSMTGRVVNPVIPSCEYALAETKLVQVSEVGVKNAAKYISQKMLAESYSPRTWRTHPLHICPPEPYSPTESLTKECLNWIFLISSLNFSFWSEKEGTSERYGVDWRKGWDTEERTVHTGYWSLVAALNRALEENIPITDPAFYSSEVLCPDSLIVNVFRAASQSTEEVPLLKERIAIMREVGSILCNNFGGSYLGFLNAFQRGRKGRGTALELVQMVTDTFPSFRDERWVNGRRVFFWKRPQILVAETWAAFYPPSPNAPHPFFPQSPGPCISSLTMFADYRVPQILHHLRILEYPNCLIEKLKKGEDVAPGSQEEVGLRAGSIVAVERVRREILRLRGVVDGDEKSEPTGVGEEVTSVLIDFYLWDLAKKIESGEEKVEGAETVEVIPAHRTRSIWY